MTGVADYAVDELIDGRYRVERQLAGGGMGSSYIATDATTGDEVVVKIPSLALIGDPAAFTRFKREREIGERLDHPRIQRLVRAGQFPGGAPYLVLSYAPGVSLRAYLTQRGALSTNEAVRLAGQLADALAYCHARGVIHRDVKPENLVRTHSGDLVLLDFGIALLKGARRITFQRLSNEIGTPDYMAPEQVRGERGDARTDVYAVGVLLYEMLTGALPFAGDTAYAVMGERLANEAPAVRLLRSSVSAQLDSVVARALRRDPRERYQTMDELRSDLADLGRVDQTREAERAAGGWDLDGMPSAGRAILIVVISLGGLIAIGVVAQLLHQAQLR